MEIKEEEGEEEIGENYSFEYKYESEDNGGDESNSIE